MLTILASITLFVSLAIVPSMASATGVAMTSGAGRTSFTGTLPTATRPAETANTATTPPRHVPPPDTSKAANCPPGVNCKIVLAGLVNGGCNWSDATRPHDLAIYGINVHTTEGSLQSALAESQDTSNCVSWNYLIAPDGTLYVSVPVDSLAYDVGNWWENTHYVEVEQVGFSENCPPVSSADFQTFVTLAKWLIQKYHLDATPTTITGHDSVPAVNDAGQPTQHWDPGVCWPWAKFLAAVGAPIVPTAPPGSLVVTINTDDSNQPVQNCPGANFTDCVPVPNATTNFLSLYTAPSTSSPLISDLYLHPDGSAGSDAEQDWGDKAPTGHDYVVIGQQPGWTEIWYGGQAAWFQDNGSVTVPTTAFVVTPKGNNPVAVYGRPLPEYNAPGWSQIPYDHQSQVALTKYEMLPGQMYPVAAVPWLGFGSLPGQVSNDYAEGCNLADCTGPGDGTVVHGKLVYLEIDWNHRWGFVQADDVSMKISLHNHWYTVKVAKDGKFVLAA